MRVVWFVVCLCLQCGAWSVFMDCVVRAVVVCGRLVQWML